MVTMDKHQRVNQTSGNQEYYSPFSLVDAGRLVMGGIDLDGASSEKANSKIVKATRFHGRPAFTERWDDEIDNVIVNRAFIGKGYDIGERLPVRSYVGRGGLDHQWHGRVWLNHPFGSSERACSPNCKKHICRKRGHHLGSDLPGNADWIDHIVGEYEAGRVTEACILTYFASSENWFRPLKKFPVCILDGRTNYLDPMTLEEVTGVTKGSCVTYLGPNLIRFHDAFSPFGEVKCSVRFYSPADIRRDFIDYIGDSDGYTEDELQLMSRIWQASYESAASSLFLPI